MTRCRDNAENVSIKGISALEEAASASEFGLNWEDHVDYIWTTGGDHVDFIWKSFGLHLEVIWIISRSHLDYIWKLFGLHREVIENHERNHMKWEKVENQNSVKS